MIVYLHPLSGAAVVALLAYVASLGLRLRTARRDRPVIAARHARLAPLAYAAVLVSWLAGALSLACRREDLAFASTFHFRTGTAMIVLLSGSALTARALRRNHPPARAWHPWLGAAAVLLAAAHAVAGLRLMP